MSSTNTEQPERILRINEVMSRTGMAQSTLYKRMKAGQFPKPLKLSERSVGWTESSVEQWIDDKITESK